MSRDHGETLSNGVSGENAGVKHCGSEEISPNDTMQHMDAYVIIGERESGKSSVARSLTGSGWSSAGRKQARLIATITVNIKVFVYPTSLQEKKIKPEDFLDLVKEQEGCEAAMFSLRPRSGNGCDDADTYLRYFIGQGWNIVRVACLGTPVSQIATDLPNRTIRGFPRITHTTPVNEVAAQVRSYFEWV